MLSGARVVAASLLIIININLNLIININIIIIFIDHHHPLLPLMLSQARVMAARLLCQTNRQKCTSPMFSIYPITFPMFSFNKRLCVSDQARLVIIIILILVVPSAVGWAETKQNDFGKAGVLRCSEGKTDGLYFSEPRLTRQNEKILIDNSAAGLLALSTAPSVQLHVSLIQ